MASNRFLLAADSLKTLMNFPSRASFFFLHFSASFCFFLSNLRISSLLISFNLSFLLLVASSAGGASSTGGSTGGSVWRVLSSISGRGSYSCVMAERIIIEMEKKQKLPKTASRLH